jgi:glycerol-3-phosphate cytidylyltransferase
VKSQVLVERRNSFVDNSETVVFSKFLKPINIEVSTKNLLDLKRIFESNQINFALIYGTLLGAVREKNFISHDHDTDLFVFREEENKITNIISTLKGLGFSVGRYTNSYISFIRDGDFIDIYFMDKKFGKYRCDGHIIPSKYLDNLIDYPFLGSTFRIPRDYKALLSYFYGEDWETPKTNVSPTHYGLYLQIRLFIKKHSIKTFLVSSWIKGKLYA